MKQTAAGFFSKEEILEGLESKNFQCITPEQDIVLKLECCRPD